MTAFDYSRTAATAARLLARFGQSGTLHVIGSTGGADPTLTETTSAMSCAVMQYDASEIDGALVLRNDVKIYAAATVTPTIADKVTVGGVKMAIVSVTTLKPSGTAVYHVIQARR